MASCHSSRELGSHGRACQFASGLSHARAARDRAYGCLAGLRFHGLRASPGSSSHEPLQRALQGVLGAEIQAGLYPPGERIRASAWARGAAGLGRGSGCSWAFSPRFCMCSLGCWFAVVSK